MLEDLQRRNYAQNTTRSYIRTVEDFARYFNCPPDRLGPRHIREYQAMLFHKRKLSPGSVAVYLAALRFFYCKTLRRAWSIADTPYPKKDHRLPQILSQQEVECLINAASTAFHRTLLMTLYATGARNAEVTRLKFRDFDKQRMVVHIQGSKGRKDRDVMLSSKLLEELREHWRRLPRSPKIWLFPRQQQPLRRSADRYENRLACLLPSRPAGRPSETSASSYSEALLRHPSTRSRRRSPHHSAPVRP